MYVVAAVVAPPGRSNGGLSNDRTTGPRRKVYAATPVTDRT